MAIVSHCNHPRIWEERRDKLYYNAGCIGVIGIFNEFDDCGFRAAYQLVPDCPDNPCARIKL